MLATLTGTAPFSLTGLADASDEAWVGPESDADEDGSTPDAGEDAPAGDEAEDEAEVTEGEPLAHGRG